jgi:hypothetical protein
MSIRNNRCAHLLFVLGLNVACGMAPAGAPPIVSQTAQKDASSAAIDGGTNPSFPDAQMNTIDAGTLIPDQGTIFADAQIPAIDAGFPPRDSGPTAPDATAAPDAMIIADSGVWPDANLSPDAGPAPADGGMVSVDSGITVPPVGDPFDVALLAGQISAANCAFYGRCEPFRFQYGLSNQTQCTMEQTQDYVRAFDIYAAAIAAGNMAFNQMDFDSCIAALNLADCELGLDSGACDFLTGQRAQGQPCLYSAECAADQYCSAQGVAVCGMCSPRIALRQDCTNDPCVSGAVCAQTNVQTSVCVPAFANENMACGDTNSGFCRGRLQCRDPQAIAAPVCVRPAGAGQLCSSASNNTPDCNLAANQVCINTVCTAVNWVGAGANCTGANGCTIDAICDQNSMTCLALPTNNQLCPQNVCAQGHFCSTGLCRTELASGAGCTDSNQCSGSLVCTGTAGNRTCENLSWQACP